MTRLSTQVEELKKDPLCTAALFVFLLILLLCVEPASASTITWDGDTSTDFTDPGNWSGGVPPANNITTDFASFTVASPLFQPSLAGAYSVTGISLGGGYTFSGGGTLTIGASGLVTTNTNTISLSSVRLGANATVNLAAGTTTVTGTNFNTNGFNLTFSRTGTTGILLDLSNAIISGTGGTVTFSAATVSNPILVGGANSFTGAATVTLTNLNFTTLAAGGTNSSFGAGTGDITIAGSNSNASITNVGAGGATDRLLKAATSGVANVINNGTGALSFNNTGTFGSINLQLGGTYAGGTNTFAEVITGAATVSKTGVSTWLMTANNSYAGTTSVASGGRLIIGHANSLGSGGLQAFGAGTTTVASGGMLDLNGVTGTINEPIIISGTGISAAGALVNNGASPVRIGTGIANLAVAQTGSGSGYTSVPTVAISGAGSGATATASLGLTTASVNSATGGTGYVTGDTVNIIGGGGTGAIGTVTASGGVITSITITTAGTGYTSAPTGMSKLTSTNGAGALTLSGNATNFTVGGLTLTNAGTGYTGTPTISFNGSAATVTPTLSSVTLAANSSIGGTGNIIIDAVVSESGGARTLTKVGAGAVTLAGANTYTGATSITGGTLQVGVTSAGSTASSSAVTINGTGAVLAGSGTVVGSVTVTQGTIRPGDSGGSTIGTLNTGSVTVSGGTNAMVVAQLDSGISGSNDKIVSSSGITFSGGSHLSVLNAPTVEGTWDLLDWAGLFNFGNNVLSTTSTTGGSIATTDNGAFLDLPTLSGGLSYDLSSFISAGQIIVTVPEPGRALLLVIGVGGLLLRRTRGL